MYRRRPRGARVTELSRRRQHGGARGRGPGAGNDEAAPDWRSRHRFVWFAGNRREEEGGLRPSTGYSVEAGPVDRWGQRERVARVRFRGLRTPPSWRAARSRTISVPSDTISVANGSICPSLRGNGKYRDPDDGRPLIARTSSEGRGTCASSDVSMASALRESSERVGGLSDGRQGIGRTTKTSPDPRRSDGVP